MIDPRDALRLTVRLHEERGGHDGISSDDPDHVDSVPFGCHVATKRDAEAALAAMMLGRGYAAPPPAKPVAASHRSVVIVRRRNGIVDRHEIVAGNC